MKFQQAVVLVGCVFRFFAETATSGGNSTKSDVFSVDVSTEKLSKRQTTIRRRSNSSNAYNPRVYDAFPMLPVKKPISLYLLVLAR